MILLTNNTVNHVTPELSAALAVARARLRRVLLPKLFLFEVKVTIVQLFSLVAREPCGRQGG